MLADVCVQVIWIELDGARGCWAGRACLAGHQVWVLLGLVCLEWSGHGAAYLMSGDFCRVRMEGKGLQIVRSSCQEAGELEVGCWAGCGRLRQGAEREAGS